MFNNETRLFKQHVELSRHRAVLSHWHLFNYYHTMTNYTAFSVWRKEREREREKDTGRRTESKWEEDKHVISPDASIHLIGIIVRGKQILYRVRRSIISHTYMSGECNNSHYKCKWDIQADVSAASVTRKKESAILQDIHILSVSSLTYIFNFIRHKRAAQKKQ